MSFDLLVVSAKVLTELFEFLLDIVSFLLTEFVVLVFFSLLISRKLVSTLNEFLNFLFLIIDVTLLLLLELLVFK